MDSMKNGSVKLRLAASSLAKSLNDYQSQGNAEHESHLDAGLLSYMEQVGRVHPNIQDSRFVRQRPIDVSLHP